jgi:putative ABC transport system substrate-binding protein
MKQFIAATLVALCVLDPAPKSALSQESGKTYRIGILNTDYDRGSDHPVLLELARRGFVEGRNLVVEQRTGPAAQLPVLARGLAEMRPDVILTVGLPAARAAHAATQTVPIIAVGSFPLEAGLVASLARPGGNLSGVSIFTAELNPKRLALLHEMVPGARRVALLREPAFAPMEHVALLEATGRDLDLAVAVVDVRRPEDIAGSLRTAREGGAEAVSVLAATLFAAPAASKVLAATAREVGLPTICQWREMAEAGCLASYGPDLAGIYKLAGRQVASVLNGASVYNLPVEQPTRLELVINARTAKTLGLTIPSSFLARADEVIE